MSKKYGLTKREKSLLRKAIYYQSMSADMHRKFANSLQNRFNNSETINEFEDWDLWKLCESGDSSGDEKREQRFWDKVRQEEGK